MSSLPCGKHLLVVAYPASGHVIPIIDFAHLLLRRGFTITVAITPRYAHLLDPFSSIQPLVLPAADAPISPEFTILKKIRGLEELREPISNWFRTHPSPPVAIVSDFFVGWTHFLALDLGVPRITFWSSGAFGGLIMSSLWHDLPENEDPTNNDNCLLSFSTIPNSPEFPSKQMSQIYFPREKGDDDNSDWDFFRNCMLTNYENWGSVFNSFTELEGAYLEHWRKNVLAHDRVWAVGPLLAQLGQDFLGSTQRGGSSALPIRELATWLDNKADNSVVYVCFGSHFLPTDAQVTALATALECSRVHFVWAMREVDSTVGRIPCGYEDRVEGRGFVIRGWAPQVPILNHRAVGAFLTHCGWNSVLEGVAAGVLMLAWPMAADQFCNAKLLEQLDVAIRVCPGGRQTVPDSTELARSLAESVSATGPERKRVLSLSEAAREAVKEGGSSFNALDDLVRHLSQLGSGM